MNLRSKAGFPVIWWLPHAVLIDRTGMPEIPISLRVGLGGPRFQEPGVLYGVL